VGVSPSTPNVTLTATAIDPAATILVNGTLTSSGAASQPLGLVDGAGTFSIIVSNQGTPTTYEVAFAPRLPAEKAHLSGITPTDHFGYSIALSADTLAVGAFGEGGRSGAVYVFIRSGASWIQQAVLKAANANAQDLFGNSVSLDADTLLVGARGEDSATTGVNGDGSNNSATNSGAAYVFVRTGTTWTQQAYLKPANTTAEASFGTSVAVSGNRVVVGAPGDASGGSNTGAAYVFARAGTAWSQQAHLKASNAAAQAVFGRSVALSGDTVAVGAPNASAVYIFVPATPWAEQALLKASDTKMWDYFGASVSLDGNTLAVGAYGSGGVSNFHRGAAYVFARNGANWAQQAVVTPLNPVDGDEFGISAAVLGNQLLVGAWQDDSSITGVNGAHNDGERESGAGYLFARSGNTWTQRAYLKASTTRMDDYLGASVALSADHLALGGETLACVFSNP